MAKFNELEQKLSAFESLATDPGEINTGNQLLVSAVRELFVTLKSLFAMIPPEIMTDALVINKYSATTFFNLDMVSELIKASSVLFGGWKYMDKQKAAVWMREVSRRADQVNTLAKKQLSNLEAWRGGEGFGYKGSSENVEGDKMTKYESLVKRVEYFERVAQYGNRNSFLQSLSQMEMPEETIEGHVPSEVKEESWHGKAPRNIDARVQVALNKLLGLRLAADGDLGPQTGTALELYRSKYHDGRNIFDPTLHHDIMLKAQLEEEAAKKSKELGSIQKTPVRPLDPNYKPASPFFEIEKLAEKKSLDLPLFQKLAYKQYDLADLNAMNESQLRAAVRNGHLSPDQWALAWQQRKQAAPPYPTPEPATPPPAAPPGEGPMGPAGPLGPPAAPPVAPPAAPAAPAAPPAAPVVPAAKPATPKPAKPAARTDDVIKKVQIALNKLKYPGKDTKPLAEDGILGGNTQFAINNWTSNNNMSGQEKNSIYDAIIKASNRPAKPATKQEAKPGTPATPAMAGGAAGMNKAVELGQNAGAYIMRSMQDPALSALITRDPNISNYMNTFSQPLGPLNMMPYYMSMTGLQKIMQNTFRANPQNAAAGRLANYLRTQTQLMYDAMTKAAP